MKNLESGVVMDTPTRTEQGELKIHVNPVSSRVSSEQEAFEAWQIASIKEGIAQAERGEFVPEEEMKSFFANWRK